MEMKASVFAKMQELFDKGIKGLASQDWKKSERPSDTPIDPSQCMYRGPDGLKCFVGHLIEDADYHESLEGRGVMMHYPVQQACGLRAIYTLADEQRLLTFLSTCQGAHDNAIERKDMKRRFRNIASMYTLSIPQELEPVGEDYL